MRHNPQWGSDYDLPDYRTETFAGSVAPVELEEGTVLYHVTDKGGEAGGYWTLQRPQSLSEVIGGTAVRPEWNGFSKLVAYEVPRGGLKVWQGPTARQQLARGVSDPHLGGGDIQVYVPDVYRWDQVAEAPNVEFMRGVIDVTSELSW